jgi:ribonuclease P protein component
VPLPKNNRLVRKKDITRILKSRKYLDTPEFRFRAILNQENKFRILITISKKVAKKANLRNKMRRKISSFFEKWFKEKSLPAGLDLMLTVKKDLTKANFDPELETLIWQKTQELLNHIIVNK